MKFKKVNTKVITFVFFLLSVSFLSLVLLISEVKQKQDLKSSAQENQTVIRRSFRLDTTKKATNRILIKQKDRSDVNLLEKDTLRDDRILDSERTLFPQYYSIETLPENSDQVINEIKNDPDVESADYEIIRSLYRIPNDPYLSDQWWISKIKLPEAWDVVLGSPTIVTAILDSGVSANHPDLSANVTQWKNFSSSPTQYDLDGHGTWVGGIVSAVTNNARGVAGSSYSSKIMSLKIANEQGYATETNIANAIKWSADNGARIINLSFGSELPSTLEEQAINYAWGRGVIITAASGNEGLGAIRYPAGYNNVFSVAATNSNDIKTNYSNYGSWVDIAAPGDSILSTTYWLNDPNNIKNVYGEGEGTSASSPIVAGVAALILSKNPNLTNQQVIDILCNTADKIQGTGSLWRCGRVNAYQAVMATGGGTTPPPSIPPTTPPTTPPGSPPASGTTSIKVRFQGITEKAENQNISLSILRNNSVIFSIPDYPASSDNQGVYQLFINNSQANITTGTYQLKIKGSSHLTKSFQNISIPDNQTLIDLSQLESHQLRSGDVNNDNKITIEDISKVLSYYNNFSTPVNPNDTQMKSADVSKDGVITIQDIALIAINWSDLSVLGD